jgi:antitoxin YefM
MSRTSDDIESLEETLAILSDPVAMEQIRESERSLAAGESTTSLAEIQAQLERRRRFQHSTGGPGLEPG